MRSVRVFLFEFLLWFMGFLCEDIDLIISLFFFFLFFLGFFFLSFVLGGLSFFLRKLMLFLNYNLMLNFGSSRSSNASGCGVFFIFYFYMVILYCILFILFLKKKYKSLCLSTREPFMEVLVFELPISSFIFCSFWISKYKRLFQFFWKKSLNFNIF